LRPQTPATWCVLGWHGLARVERAGAGSCPHQPISDRSLQSLTLTACGAAYRASCWQRATRTQTPPVTPMPAFACAQATILPATNLPAAKPST